MNRFILDTDTITLLKQGHSRVSDRTLAQPVGSVITSVITVDEQLSGWYTAIRKASRHNSFPTAMRSWRKRSTISATSSSWVFLSQRLKSSSVCVV